MSGPRPIICTGTIYTRNRGRVASLPYSTEIETVCGRTPSILFRGVNVRRDGSLQLLPWAGRCSACMGPGWADWIVAEHPGLSREQIEMTLDGATS